MAEKTRDLQEYALNELERRSADEILGRMQEHRGLFQIRRDEDHYGEPLVLFHWTEGADLVTDIDVFIWGEAKTRGAAVGPDVDWQEVITTTNATIQREFSERISDIVPWTDAERISAGLYGTPGK